MKPRLCPIAHTPEDTAIWFNVIMRTGLTANLLFGTCGFQADRRDADLMLQARYKRLFVGGYVTHNTAFRCGLIDAGGRLP